MAAINWIDVSIMIIILLNMIIGIRRGIIRGIINLIGVITAIFLAIFWFKEVGEFISSHSQISGEIANILGFAAVFGLIKGSLIVGILLVIISFIPLPVFLKEQLENSFLANRFAVMTTIVYDYLKDWLPLSFQFNTEEFLKKFHLNLIVLKDTVKYFVSI